MDVINTNYESESNFGKEDEKVSWLSPAEVAQTMRKYFQTGQYKLISHVMGTLVVFFLVGMRVEAMIATTGIYDPSENTWELNLAASFWWQTTWYMLFIIIGCVILMLFQSRKHRTTISEQSVFVSAVLDILLSGACLAILMIAETQRCCEIEPYDNIYILDDLGYRSLAETDTYEATTGDEYALSELTILFCSTDLLYIVSILYTIYVSASRQH